MGEELHLQHHLCPIHYVQCDVRRWNLRCMAPVSRRRHRRHRLLRKTWGRP